LLPVVLSQAQIILPYIEPVNTVIIDSFRKLIEF